MSILLPKTLRDQLKARRVVPFVGAGVSMAVLDKDTGSPLFPSWKQLLESAIDLLEADQQEADAMLVKGFLARARPEYLEAAKWAHKGLEGRLYTLLKDQVDVEQRKAQDSSLELARLIWGLGSPLVITTNYDRVLRWTAPSGGDCHILDNNQPAELRRLSSYTPTRSTLWYLHGRIDHASTLILTPDGYERLYLSGGSSNAKTDFEAALLTLRNLIASRTLLFIGYSMDDEYLTNQLQIIRDLYEGSEETHYALISERQREQVERLKLPVRIIPYESHGEPLLEVLREMGELSGVNRDQTLLTPNVVTSQSSADYNPRHPSFNVPYRQKGSQVLGRDEPLDAVRSQLTSGNLTAIGQTASFQGIGGLGKTQLAVEYAYRFFDTYPSGIVWINADSEIEPQLIELAQNAKWVSPQSEHRSKLDLALHRVRNFSGGLIIFDNVEDIGSIKPYLPVHSATPHILITSRLPQTGFNPVALDVLPSDISYQLLLQEANRIPLGDSQESDARSIVEALGNLPLAIELAGAFIKHRSVGWNEYLELIRGNLKAALPSNFSSFTEHESNLYQTLRIDDAIFAEEPLLREILDILTWSGPAPMSKELLANLAEVTSLELTAPIALGVGLRLLQKLPDVESYAIHRLVRQVRQVEVVLEERLDWVQCKSRLLARWLREKRTKLDELPTFEREMPHLSAWQKISAQHGSPEGVQLLWLQAYPLFYRGRYRDSYDIVSRSYNLFQEANLDDDKLRSEILLDLATLENKLANYSQASIYFEQCLKLSQSFSGKDSVNVAAFMRAMATPLYENNQVKRAFQLLYSALDIQKKSHNGPHEDIILSLRELAALYGEEGDYSAAKIKLDEAMSMIESLGESYQSFQGEMILAGILSQYGVIYDRIEMYDESIYHHKEAIAIVSRVLGNEHPYTLNAMANLAQVYGNVSMYDESIAIFGKVLNYDIELLGAESREVGIAMYNLSFVYEEKGDLEMAINTMTEAARIISLNDDGMDMGGIRMTINWAKMLHRNGRLTESFAVVDGILTRLSPTHPEFAETEKNALNILREVRNLKKNSPVFIIYREKWRKKKSYSSHKQKGSSS